MNIYLFAAIWAIGTVVSILSFRAFDLKYFGKFRMIGTVVIYCVVLSWFALVLVALLFSQQRKLKKDYDKEVEDMKEENRLN